MATLINLVTLRHFTLFQPTVKAIKSKKGQKFVLVDYCFSNLFTEVKIWYWKHFKFVLGCFLERYTSVYHVYKSHTALLVVKGKQWISKYYDNDCGEGLWPMLLHSLVCLIHVFTLLSKITILSVLHFSVANRRYLVNELKV